MSKLVSIHSFRGGTGKSNITANVAVNIARRGKRVGVIDCDIQSPGIHVLFGLEPEATDRTLNDYLYGHCPIDEAAYDLTKHLDAEMAAIADAGGALYLVPSSIKAVEIARVLREGYDVTLLHDGFRELSDRLKLDYLFIDTHPGLNEETLMSIAMSDIFLIVMRPDQQDIQGTAVTVEVAQRLDVPRMLLVVNMVLTSYDFDDVRQRMESTYGVPVAGVLPLPEDVVRTESGQIFSLCSPDHFWSQVVGAVATQVMA